MLGITLFVGIWGWRQDQKDAQQKEEEEDEVPLQLEEIEKAKVQGQGLLDETGEVIPMDETVVQKLLRESLPRFARIRTYWKLALVTLQQKHDW